VFVNKQCDIRFFRDEREKDNLTYENEKQSVNGNANSKSIKYKNKKDNETCLEESQISLGENYIYTNAKPGSVIESGVTLNGSTEFYIISSYSQRGTCNPTHYYVELNEGEFDKTILYKITYDLTYLYFNNQKCIRMPVILHNASRMGQMASKHLKDSFYGKPNYNFGY